MTRTRTIALIAAALALAAFPVAAPAVADHLRSEGGSVAGAPPLPGGLARDAAPDVAVPPAPGGPLAAAELTPAQIRFMEQYEELRAQAAAERRAGQQPPAPVDPAAVPGAVAAPAAG